MVHVATTQASLQLLLNHLALIFVYLHQDVRFSIFFVKSSLLNTFNYKGKSDVIAAGKFFQFFDGLHFIF